MELDAPTLWLQTTHSHFSPVDGAFPVLKAKGLHLRALAKRRGSHLLGTCPCSQGRCWHSCPFPAGRCWLCWHIVPQNWLGMGLSTLYGGRRGWLVKKWRKPSILNQTSQLFWFGFQGVVWRLCWVGAGSDFISAPPSLNTYRWKGVHLPFAPRTL